MRVPINTNLGLTPKLEVLGSVVPTVNPAAHIASPMRHLGALKTILELDSAILALDGSILELD